MIRKAIFFFFSPMFAVVAMVVPDAWTLCEYKHVEMQKISNAVSPFRDTSEKMGYIALEERGWKGDWRAIERIGERCANVKPTFGWDETYRLWNRMFCAFLLPMACFAVIFYPLGFMLAFLDIRRLKKGLSPKHWQPFHAKIKGMEKHFNLFLVVWMSIAYYVFRYWTLSA